MACAAEIDSFILKFKNLQYAGQKAILTLEAENGKAIVSLKAELGCLSPPDHLLPTRPGYTAAARLHRSPSYFRRQERRRQAAQAAVGPDGEQAGQATVTIPENNAAQVEQEIGQAEEVCGINHALEIENLEFN